MGTELAVEVAKQVPALAVLVFVVMRFLNHIRDSEMSQKGAAEAFNKALASVDDRYQAHETAMYGRADKLTDRLEFLIKQQGELLQKQGELLGKASYIIADFERSKPK